MTLGEFPPLTHADIADQRGFNAARHRELDRQKKLSADRGERDRLTEEMVRLEELNRKLGEYL